MLFLATQISNLLYLLYKPQHTPYFFTHMVFIFHFRAHISFIFLSKPPLLIYINLLTWPLFIYLNPYALLPPPNSTYALFSNGTPILHILYISLLDSPSVSLYQLYTCFIYLHTPPHILYLPKQPRFIILPQPHTCFIYPRKPPNYSLFSLPKPNTVCLST